MIGIVPNNIIPTDTTFFVLQGRYIPSVDIDFKEETCYMVTLHFGQVPSCGSQLSVTDTLLQGTLLYMFVVSNKLPQL